MTRRRLHAIATGAPVDHEARVPIQHRLREGENIFTQRAKVIAGIRDAVAKAGLAGQLMRLRIGVNHRLRVRARGGGDRIVPGKRLRRSKRAHLREKSGARYAEEVNRALDSRIRRCQRRIAVDVVRCVAQRIQARCVHIFKQKLFEVSRPWHLRAFERMRSAART